MTRNLQRSRHTTDSAFAALGETRCCPLRNRQRSRRLAGVPALLMTALGADESVNLCVAGRLVRQSLPVSGAVVPVKSP